MPTKPAGVYTVATDLNYSSGAAVGFPTKSATVSANEGFFPDTPIAAEEFNYLFNITGAWTAWLNAGTPLPVIDTTIVERDINGRSQFAICQTGGTASALSSLIVDSNTGQAPGDPSSTFANTNDGASIDASANSAASPAIGATNSGTGPGLQGISVGGIGVNGLSSNTVASVGVRGEARTADSVGVGGVGFPDADSLPAVTGSCSSPNSIGVQGIILNVAGTSTGAAVEGNSVISPDGVGVRAVSSGGYALTAEADVSSPLRSAFRLVPQDADPTSPLEGDEYHNLLGYRRVFADSTWRSVTTQPGNTVRQFDLQAGPFVIDGTDVTCATASLGINNQPLVAGSVLLTASFQAGRAVATAGPENELFVEIFDVTAGVQVAERRYPIVAQPTALDLIINGTIQVEYTLPATGARIFELRATRNAGPENYRLTNAALRVEGVY